MTTTIDPATVDAETRLTAVEDIRLLRARYWRFVDTKDWAGFRTLFAPEATFSDHSADFHCHGADDIAGKISAVLEPVFTAHHGHQAEILVHDAEHASGIWAMDDYLIFPPGVSHPTNPMPTEVVRGWGHYYDEYVKRDGRWQFAKVDLYRLRLEVGGSSSTPYPSAPER
jgi:hypothetical protein